MLLIVTEIVSIVSKPYKRTCLGSRSEGRGFNPRPMLDESGVKAMPGSIPTPQYWFIIEK